MPQETFSAWDYTRLLKEPMPESRSPEAPAFRQGSSHKANNEDPCLTILRFWSLPPTSVTHSSEHRRPVPPRRISPARPHVNLPWPHDGVTVALRVL